MGKAEATATLWAALLIAGTLPLAGATSVAGQTPVGCYDVEMGAFTPEIGLGRDSLFFAPPGRVFFDSVVVGRERGWDEGYRALRLAEGALPSIHERAGWIAQGDSLRLAWSDQTGTGLRAVVVETRDGFAGEAQTFADLHPHQVQTASITLRRVSCDSPPPLTVLDQRQLLTSLAFADGTRIELDAPFIPGPGWEKKSYERASTFVLPDPAVDLLGQVLSVEVWPREDGAVGRIDVHFHPTEDFEAVAQKVVDEIGEPVLRSERTRDEVKTLYLRWENRTHGTTLRGTQAPGGLWEVVLHLEAQVWGG